MKLLLDNNIPRKISGVFSGHECSVVKDVLSADAADNEIFAWCKKHHVDILVTKDRQFSWIIASGDVRLKCILCVFGNLSIQETISLFEQNKTKIEYFAKTNAKILEIQ